MGLLLGRGRLLPRRGLHRVRRVRVAGWGLRVRGAGNGICEGERVRRWSRAISGAGDITSRYWTRRIERNMIGNIYRSVEVMLSKNKNLFWSKKKKKKKKKK